MNRVDAKGKVRYVLAFVRNFWSNRKERLDKHDITTPVRPQLSHISPGIRGAFRAAPGSVRRRAPTSPTPPFAPPGELTRGAPLTQMPHRVARELIASRVADAEQRRLALRAARARRRTADRRID